MVNPKHLSATVDKLIPFYHHINRRNGPITLTVFPTTKCNLNCEFCSNYEDKKNPNNLPIPTILETINQFPSLLSIEISGGGEPTLYPEINTLIYVLHRLKFEVGLITNGTRLHLLTPDSLKRLAWLRVSVNGLIDHNYAIDWKLIESVNYVGITYIHHAFSPEVYMGLLRELKIDAPFLKYCKICNNSYRELHETKAEIIDNWIYTYDHSWDKPLSDCYCGSVKPVLATNGYLYPCSALVLFDGKYQIEDRITPDQIKAYTPFKCTKAKCPAVDKNQLLQSMLLSNNDPFWKFV